LLFFKRAVCFCHPSSEQVFVSLGVEWSRTSTVYLVLYCLYSLRDEVKHRDDPRVLEISLEPATEELGHRDWLKDCVAGDTSAIDVPSIFVVAVVVATTSSSTENLAADDDGWCDTRPGLSVGVRVKLASGYDSTDYPGIDMARTHGIIIGVVGRYFNVHWFFDPAASSKVLVVQKYQSKNIFPAILCECPNFALEIQFPPSP
jgi:hypothetical protein